MKITDQVFFVIDSDHLEGVEDKFIGYALSREGDSIYKNDDSYYPTGAFIDISAGGGQNIR